MQELLKKIREYINYSQTEMADELGVSFATINRWENGHAIPNNLAQDKIYNFCLKKSIPLYDFIIQNINDISNNIKLENNRILLFHGSKLGIEGRIGPKSRNACDFGKGFYMGSEPSQSLTLICDFPKSKFYIVSIDKNDLNTIEIETDIKWAMVVAYNRGRMNKIKDSQLYNFYKNYLLNKDLVIGNIADDRMFNVIDNFFEGMITDKALVFSFSALKLGKQYVMLTQKGCDRVRIEKEISLSYLERKCLQKVSIENRLKGVNLANDICKNYRREGYFFDELLDSALKEEK